MVTILLCVGAALMGRKMPATNLRVRQAVWAVLIGYVALGPVMIQLTPTLAAKRIAYDDQIARYGSKL